MSAPELLSPEVSANAFPPSLEVVGGGFQDPDVIQAAQTGACVLLTGRPNAKGIALLIHHLSGWRWGPFISVDCGASEQVLERQLFDVLKAGSDWDLGAQPRAQLMQDGTIFLYEIGKLSLAMQTRLADALGSASTGTSRRLRKRVMASTSIPLLDRVNEGTFDDRLFYRLNAIHFMPVR